MNSNCLQMTNNRNLFFIILGDMIKSLKYNAIFSNIFTLIIFFLFFYANDKKNLSKWELKFVGQWKNGSNIKNLFKLWLLSNAYCTLSYATVGWAQKSAEWKKFRTTAKLCVIRFQIIIQAHHQLFLCTIWFKHGLNGENKTHRLA